MDQTARFGFPCLAPGQAGKEWWHNEALAQIDMLVCPVVETLPLGGPPENPVAGECFAVADEATGDRVGQGGSLAVFTDGGWRFALQREGLRALVRQTGETLVRHSGAWEAGVLRGQELQVAGEVVVSGRQPAVPLPSGGPTVDGECREAVTAIVAALTAHGLIAA